MKYFFLASAFFASAANAAGAPVPVGNLGVNGYYWVNTAAGVEAMTLAQYGRSIGSTATSLGVSGGALSATRTGQLVLKNGVYLPVTASARVSGPVIGAMVKKALPLVGVALAGPAGVALTSLAFELGYKLIADGPDDDTAPDLLKSTGGKVCTSDCYLYRGRIYGTGTPSPSAFVPDLSAECSAYISAFSAANPYHVVSNIVSTYEGANPACTFTAQRSGYQTGYYSMTIDKQASAPYDTRTYSPVTSQEFADAIANKTDWSDSSVIAEALSQSQRLTGDQITTGLPKISGPASVTGPATVTKTPTTNGTKETTSQDTFDCHYNDPSYDGTIPGTVVCTQKTVTTDKVTTTDPSTGQTTTTTTQTSETTKPAETSVPEESAPTDTANPDLPKLYERKYPDGLTGVWAARKAELNSSSLLTLLHTMTPSISGSPGCPQFTIPATIGPLLFGSGYQGPPCYIWDFCRVIVLLSAAFLARALIFGG